MLYLFITSNIVKKNWGRVELAKRVRSEDKEDE